MMSWRAAGARVVGGSLRRKAGALARAVVRLRAGPRTGGCIGSRPWVVDGHSAITMGVHMVRAKGSQVAAG